jgi:hypothetical protein
MLNGTPPKKGRCRPATAHSNSLSSTTTPRADLDAFWTLHSFGPMRRTPKGKNDHHVKLVSIHKKREYLILCNLDHHANGLPGLPNPKSHNATSNPQTTTVVQTARVAYGNGTHPHTQETNHAIHRFAQNIHHTCMPHYQGFTGPRIIAHQQRTQHSSVMHSPV